MEPHTHDLIHYDNFLLIHFYIIHAFKQQVTTKLSLFFNKSEFEQDMKKVEIKSWLQISFVQALTQVHKSVPKCVKYEAEREARTVLDICMKMS